MNGLCKFILMVHDNCSKHILMRDQSNMKLIMIVSEHHDVEMWLWIIMMLLTIGETYCCWPWKWGLQPQCYLQLHLVGFVESFLQNCGMEVVT